MSIRKNINGFLIAILSASPMVLFGQTSIEKISSLPPTDVIRAPEFDVEKKYTAQIDTVQNLLFIYDYRRHPTRGEEHFDHLLYEIPLEQMGLGSITLESSTPKRDISRIKFVVTGEEASIVQYWIRYGEVVCIQMQKELALGPWTTDESIKATLESTLETMRSEFISSGNEVNKYQMPKIIYKYGTDKVTMIGLKDLDGLLYNDYYYESALDTTTLYNSERNPTASRKALIKDIKDLITTSKNATRNKTVILMHIDSVGSLESIALILPKTFDDQLNTASLRKFKPGIKNGNAVKSKILLIY